MTSLITFFWISVKFSKCASMDSNNGFLLISISNIAASSEGQIWNNDKLTPKVETATGKTDLIPLPPLFIIVKIGILYQL